MNELHKKAGGGKPVKPSKPVPSKEVGVKIAVPVSMTEERVREIAREEIMKDTREKAIFALGEEDQGRF